MSRMFCDAKRFNADISKWDVSSVIDMSQMFVVSRFNRDISNWDVSRVIDMHDMFRSAVFFQGDISKWDVSRVTDMDSMFMRAKSFKQHLCEAAWVHSKASQKFMFEDSRGSISLMPTLPLLSCATSLAGFASPPQARSG